MIRRGLASLCALALLPGFAALAQEVPEIRILPPPSGEVQPTPAPETPAEAPVPAPRDATGPAAAPLARQRFLTLRPLAELPRRVAMGASLPEPGVVRLTGEVAESEFALWLPEGMALPETLALSLRTSIDVLPDTAVLQVRVNGAEPVDLPLGNFAGFGALEVPAPNLAAGMNRIGIALSQPHRIYCGPDASFQVWTEIELARSGIEYPVDALEADAATFSLAAGNRIAAGHPLTLLADQDADPATIRDLATALGGQMQGQGRVAIRSFYAQGSGGGASVALIPSEESRISYRRDGTGAPVLQVETAGGALPDLTSLLLPEALPQPRPVPVLVPGKVQDLGDLGADDIVANTHYFRRDIAFRLPPDWLLLANQKAQIGLRYGFAADLPKGAMLLVKVNDETVRLLPLDREGGRLLEPLAIRFGTRLLHPGLNNLSFEMMVPGDPPDAACAPRRTDMLVVTRDTTIEVPTSPAMRLQGIGVPLSGLTAAGIKVGPGATEPGRMALVAAELAAGLTPPETPDDRVRLRLTDIAGLSQSGDGVPARVVQDALLPASAPTEAPTEAAPAAPGPRFRLSEDSPPPEATPAIAEATPEDGGGIGGWFAHQRERIRDAAFMSSGEALGDWLAGRKGDALLMPGPADEPQALQLILGPGADMDRIGDTLNALRDAWLGEGKAVLIANDGTWQVWSSARLPRMEGAVTPLNLLPVLGNYASWSPFLFTAGLLVFGLISVIPALIIVVVFRKRRIR